MATGYCAKCSAEGPSSNFTKKAIQHHPRGARAMQCVDENRCEARSRARAVLYGFRADGYAAKTPPGCAILAILRAASGPVDSTVVEACVRIMLRDATDGEIMRDVYHARGSGLIVERAGTWILGEGERVAAVLATMPFNGPHALAAHAALCVSKSVL